MYYYVYHNGYQNRYIIGWGFNMSMAERVSNECLGCVAVRARLLNE